MDDCFTERLVYSASEESDVDEPVQPFEDDPVPIENTAIDFPTQNGESDESDEDINKSIVKCKKAAKILSSDDEDDFNDDENKEEMNNDESNEEKHSDNESHMDVDNTPQEPNTNKVRPSICDSDTKSSGDENPIDAIKEQKKLKKLKKVKNKKEKEKPKQNKKQKKIPKSDESESDSDRSSVGKQKPKEKKKQKQKQKKNLARSSSKSNSSCSDEASETESSAQSDDDDQTKGTKLIKPRAKPPKRMSAKMAQEQMEEIQSESQRLKRNMIISVPYHKPKQHTLKEFLSRRSIIEQEEKAKSRLFQKPAVAIKMSGEELIQFVADLKKREEEALEFFADVGSEEENSKMNGSDDSNESEEETVAPTENAVNADATDVPDVSAVSAVSAVNEATEVAEIVENKSSAEPEKAILDQNDTSTAEDDGALQAKNELAPAQAIETEDVVDQHPEPSTSDQPPEPSTSDPNQPNESTETTDLFTHHVDLDDELDKMGIVVEKKPKLSVPTDFVPKLEGGKGFVIDLETNDLKPAPKTGVDELLSRFMKNALVKTHDAESQDFGIFRTDTGSIERHKVHLNLSDKVKRDPKPGESLFKLRHELGMKIRENREKIIAQRMKEIEEEKMKEKQMEMEDDELEEEQSECGENDADNDDEIDTLNEEVIEPKEDNIESNDENGDDESSSESETEELGEITIDAQKARKRIVTMDDDSDDDSHQDAPKGEQTDASKIPNESQHTDNLAADISMDEVSKTIQNQDLSALESEILQLNNSSTENEPTKTQPKENTTLFLNGSDDCDDIGESQLMALCSGTFATQFLDNSSLPNKASTQMNGLIEVNTVVNAPTSNPKAVEFSNEEIKEISQSKPAFLSSDEEDVEKEIKQKPKKKKIKQAVVYSDNEDDEDDVDAKRVATPEALDEESNGSIEGSVEDEQGDEENADDEENEEGEEDPGEQYDEEDPGEQYVEYDSDENEVQVKLKKKDIRKKASEFFENEAELSESEWGSADEDEKDNDHYEAELGDLDKFDKNKLRGELERIRLREQIDDDARDIRILTERFIEEEDNGQERERKFRWKHLNNGDLLDDRPFSNDQEPEMEPNSDDENEAEWRRIRYEREQLLKQQQQKDADLVVERTSAVLDSAEVTTVVGNATTIACTTKRLSIIKPVSSKTASPFLINKSDLNLGHLSRKSFLNRDGPILEKLASLSKSGGDNEVILNKAKGKGNYVFVATEKKDNPKRKSESGVGETDFEVINPSKKSKLDLQKQTKIRPQTKVFFDSLN